MNREVHVRFWEGLAVRSAGLLNFLDTFARSRYKITHAPSPTPRCLRFSSIISWIMNKDSRPLLSLTVSTMPAYRMLSLARLLTRRWAGCRSSSSSSV